MALSPENKNNLGLIKSAIERCKVSANLFSTMLGMGVELRNFLFVGENGTYETIESPMEYIRQLWSQCIQREQEAIREEKMEFEKMKTLQALSNEDLKVRKLWT